MFRAPIAIYRLGLGFVFGRRFLMLGHRGWKSGIKRRTVLEVVANRPDALYVAAAWGNRSHWLKNVMIDPKVEVSWGVRRFETVAARVDPEEARSVFAEYADAHPIALARLARFMLDDPGEDNEESVRRLAASVPLVELPKT
jgi:deazaflavin-dependent oxidoreductase (nitroreductase family)